MELKDTISIKIRCAEFLHSNKTTITLPSERIGIENEPDCIWWFRYLVYKSSLRDSFKALPNVTQEIKKEILIFVLLTPANFRN